MFYLQYYAWPIRWANKFSVVKNKNKLHDGNETQIVRRNISKICAMRWSLDRLAVFYDILWISLFVTFKMEITCMWPSSPFLINIMDSNWFFNYWCRQFPVICSLIDTPSLCINSIKIALQRNSSKKYLLDKSDHSHCLTMNSIKSKNTKKKKKKQRRPVNQINNRMK